MSNLTNSTICQLENSEQFFWSIRKGVFLFAYYVVTPLHLVVGLPGQILRLVALRADRNEEKAYIYQIYTAISKLCELISVTAVFVPLVKWWSGADYSDGARWFQQSYFLMFCSAYLATPIVNVFVTSSLLLSLIMAMDRWAALSKPIWYMTIDHGLYRRSAVLICCVISLITNIFDAFRYNILDMQNNSDYRIVLNFHYLASPLATYMAHSRNLVRIVGVGALILFNILLLRAYRKRINNVRHLTSAISWEQNDLKRRRVEKMLVKLTLGQSLLTTIAVSTNIVFYACLYTVPGFAECGALIFAPLLNISVELTNFIEFYFVLIVCKRFRQSVRRVISDLHCL